MFQCVLFAPSVAVWIRSSETCEFWGVGSFSPPGGEALGCASGRLVWGTAAHISCERERRGVTRGCGTVVSSAGGDRKEEEGEWGGWKIETQHLLSSSLNATRQKGKVWWECLVTHKCPCLNVGGSLLVSGVVLPLETSQFVGSWVGDASPEPCECITCSREVKAVKDSWRYEHIQFVHVKIFWPLNEQNDA